MSASSRLASVLAPAVLLASMMAGTAVAEDEAAAASPTPPAPAIEIVRDGGVAEAYRRDGVDFATYGPDGAAVVPTPEAQALQALAAAYDVEFVSLAAAPGGKDPVPCPASDCVGGIAVIGRVPVETKAQWALANDIVGGWLQKPGGRWSACMPEYHHALTYTSGGHAWEVLLCYGCGQYLIRRDGVDLAWADAAVHPGHAEMNELLRAANIRHWDADAQAWRAATTD